MIFIYLIIFFIGIILGIAIFKRAQAKLNLVLFLLSLPYMILLITSLPQYYPQTEFLRFAYFICILGVLAGCAIKEKIEKKRLSN